MATPRRVYVFSVPRATKRVARQRRSRGRGSRRGAHGHAGRGRRPRHPGRASLPWLDREPYPCQGPTRRAEGDCTAQGPCHPA